MCTAGFKSSTTKCQAIKVDDDDCHKKTLAAKSPIFTVGYAYSNPSFSGYADDARATITCNTAGGYSGVADVACEGATKGEALSLPGMCARVV